MMVDKHKNKKCSYLLPFFVLLVCFVNCTFHPQNKVHSNHRYVDSIIDQADIMLPDSAIRYLHTAYGALDHPGIEDLYKKYEHLFYVNRGNVSNVIMYADSMLFILKGYEKDTTYAELYVKALLKKGEALADNKIYTEAYKAYFLATRLSEHIVKTSASNEYYRSLGDMSSRFGKKKEAINYYKRMIRKQGNFLYEDPFEIYTEQQAVLLIIGNTYRDLKINDSAMVYFNKALKLNETYSGPEPDKGGYRKTTKGYIEYSIFEIEYANKEYVKAEKLLTTSILILDSLGHIKSKLQSMKCRLANLYFDMGLSQRTDSVLQVIRKSLNESPCEGNEYRWNLIASKQAAKKGDTKQAYFYLAKYNEIKEEFDNTLVNENNIDLSREFEQIEKDEEILLLKQEHKKKLVYIVLISCIA